jgi:PAS domain-containing protein
MAQQDVEMILVRRMAGMLAMPAFLMGADGTLLYYNEAAEHILGQRYEESGPMPVEELGPIFDARDEEGNMIPSEQLPVSIALLKRQPAHLKMGIRGLDGLKREISVTAFPLEGQGGRHLGALALFWEDPVA